MSTSAERMRAWTGPAVLSFGFRPLFLFGAIWAALAMAIWILVLAGQEILPTAFDPVSWHAHEMLFGFLGAVMAGFLLTAVPNWTGSFLIVGWPLAGLTTLWILGRVMVAISSHLPPLAVVLADLAFPLALAAVLTREIIAGRNWKNLPVLALLAGWIIANTLFHPEAARGGYPAQAFGLRLGLATAVACGLTGLAHVWRLARWQGSQTGAKALVWVLHAGYAFVPLGFLALAARVFAPGMGSATQHIWMAGALGLMTLAVMTRASLGHAGRPRKAHPEHNRSTGPHCDS